MPMQITHSLSKTLKAQQKFDCTPTYIEVGAGSFQEGMPILCGSSGSRGSQKSLNNETNNLVGDSIVESLAEAMNDLNTSNSSSSHVSFNQRMLHSNQSRGKPHMPQPLSSAATPAIAITNPYKTKEQNTMLYTTTTQTGMPAMAASSSGSNNSVLTVGSYFLINPTMSGASNIDTTSLPVGGGPGVSNGPGHTSSASFTSSGSSSSNNSSAHMNNDDDSSSSNSSSIHSSLSMARRTGEEPYGRDHAPSLENIQFHDDTNLLH